VNTIDWKGELRKVKGQVVRLSVVVVVIVKEIILRKLLEDFLRF
jgi:hypothetical protein